MEVSARHTYEQSGPFTRARVSVYGRTQLEALEAARVAGQRLAEALPLGVTCRPAAYEGFDMDLHKHTAVVVVAFGASDAEAARGAIDALVADL